MLNPVLSTLQGGVFLGLKNFKSGSTAKKRAGD
jgi:hypothetical protein